MLFSILRTPVWPTLVRRLDHAISTDPTHRAARDAILRPAELLELMAKETPRALGDDMLAFERLRSLIHFAWPYAFEAEQLSISTPASTPSIPASAPIARLPAAAPPSAVLAPASATNLEEAPYEPGVLDLGALLIIGLAAIRVAPPGRAHDFLRTVHGVALAAEFVEAIGRLDPQMPEEEALVKLATAMQMFERWLGDRYRPFDHDPIEHARRRCLHTIFTWLMSEADTPERWHGAFSDDITDVSFQDRDLIISGPLRRLANATAFPSEEMALVLASAGRVPIAAEATIERLFDRTTLRVKLPDGIDSGWVGLSVDAAVRNSNTHRARLRGDPDAEEGTDGESATESLADIFRDHPCLKRTRIPAEVIPNLGPVVAAPPRTGANRFEPSDRAADVPRSLDDADAAIILVRPFILGHDAVPRDDAYAQIRAAARELGLGRVAIEELPFVDDELAVLRERPGSTEAPGTVPILEALSRRAMTTRGTEHALWLALIPSYEEATVAREIPATAARGIAVADRTGLADVLRSCFASGDRKIQPLVPRLRVLGRVISRRVEIHSVQEESRRAGLGLPIRTELEAVFYDDDDRELGRSPIHSSILSASFQLELLLPISRDVARVDVVHRRADVLATIPRTAGEATSFEAELDGTGARRRLSWRYDHPLAVPPKITILARSGSIVTPVFSVSPCDTSVDLPVSRLTRADQLIAVANDGWSYVETELELEPPIENDAPIMLRSLGDHRFYADVPDETWSVSWSLDGVALEPEPAQVLAVVSKARATSFSLGPRPPARRVSPDGRTVTLDPRDRGLLAMVAKKSRRVVKEYREITPEEGAR